MNAESLTLKYPQLIAALRTDLSEACAHAVLNENTISTEITQIAGDGSAFFSAALVLLFDGSPPAGNEFWAFARRVARRLGHANANVVISGLWVSAFQMWSSPQRIQFLNLIASDRHHVFEALDWSVESFKSVPFSVDEIFPWIILVQAQIGGDLYKHGLLGCFQGFCSKSPLPAVRVVEMWLDTRPAKPALAIIGRMVGWLRAQSTTNLHLAESFQNLEQRIRSGGNPAWRASYIESWAVNISGESCGEGQVLDLKRQFPSMGEDEEAAWCFLLCSLSGPQSDWVYRELRAVAKGTLGSVAKYWVALSALQLITNSTDRSSGDPFVLLGNVLPLAPTDIAIWERVDDTLVRLIESASVSALNELVQCVAINSGASWFEVASREFKSFFQSMKRAGLHTVVSSELCLHRLSQARQMGLLIFDECEVDALDVQRLRTATTTQVTLLVLEAQRRVFGFVALAKLHASLVERVEAIDDVQLNEIFFDEVATQCLNTHAYRQTLRTANPGHEYLQAILKDVDERLAATSKASQSPALRIQFPSLARAQALHDDWFRREVSKSIEEHSIFVKLFPRIHLLYGGHNWRDFSRGALSAPHTMHTASSSVEVPRLDLIDPEGMQLRRLKAAMQIAHLTEAPK